MKTRQIIGLLAYTAISNRLGIHQEETQLTIKVTFKKKKSSKFTTSRKLLKTFRQTSLSIRSRSSLLGVAEETELLRVKEFYLKLFLKKRTIINFSF